MNNPVHEIQRVGSNRLYGQFVGFNYTCHIFLFVFWPDSPQWATASSNTRFLDHARRSTVGRTPLDE